MNVKKLLNIVRIDICGLCKKKLEIYAT